MPRILIIEDGKCILETLGEFSEILGYAPILVDDPSWCLPCIDKYKCPLERSCADVMLVDHYLPTMFGLNFIEELSRKGCKVPGRSRAIITGVFSSQESERANNLGCDVLLKPVTFEKLKSWLSSIENAAAM